jgi:3-keto-disaccharide hydrolase
MRLAALTLITVLSMAAPAARAQDSAANTLTPSEVKQGWRLLFDGKSLNGWEARPTGNPRSKQAPGEPDWAVENGSLVCGGTTPSWIGTVDTFANYVLKVQFRGPAMVNSGVFLRSQKVGQPHVTGYELQIWDAQPAGFNTGSLVGTVKASSTNIIPDQWNQYEITADGDHFVVVLNGKTLLDAHDAAHASGVIGFQCQRNQHIEFRNIKVLPR